MRHDDEERRSASLKQGWPSIFAIFDQRRAEGGGRL